MNANARTGDKNLLSFQSDIASINDSLNALQARIGSMAKCEPTLRFDLLQLKAEVDFYVRLALIRASAMLGKILVGASEVTSADIIQEKRVIMEGRELSQI